MNSLSSDNTSYSWDQLIDEFRSFGGIVENVVQRPGPYGLGLFPIDHDQPIKIIVPDHLLIPAENVALRDGQITLNQRNNFPEGYVEWFEIFQREYSWGADGRKSSAAFVAGQTSLPNLIKDDLAFYGLYRLEVFFPGKDPELELFNHFVRTRRILKNKRQVLMPIIELVNHSPKGRHWDMQQSHIGLEGRFEGEVLANYSPSDPIRRFFQYGFNSQDFQGFSLRLNLKHHDHKILVKGGINPDFAIPCSVEYESDVLMINKPWITSMTSPRKPRELFAKALIDQKKLDPDEIFDKILLRNRQMIITLIKKVENINEVNPFLLELKTACYNQLISLCYAVGSRRD